MDVANVMAILFKAEHVPMILAGDKTQTRRLGKRRWTPGTPQWGKTGFTVDSRFAYLMIEAVRTKGRLGDMSSEDVRAEGYDNREEYFAVFKRIYGEVDLALMPREVDLDMVPWVIDFTVVE